MISVQLFGSGVAEAVGLTAATRTGWTTRRFLEFTGAFLSYVDATGFGEFSSSTDGTTMCVDFMVKPTFLLLLFVQGGRRR